MCEPRGKKYNNWQHKPETVLSSEAGEKKNTSTLKIRITRDTRESLREQLDLGGINRATLFPGPWISCEVLGAGSASAQEALAQVARLLWLRLARVKQPTSPNLGETDEQPHGLMQCPVGLC
jgi:hypothetical protein